MSRKSPVVASLSDRCRRAARGPWSLQRTRPWPTVTCSKGRGGEFARRGVIVELAPMREPARQAKIEATELVVLLSTFLVLAVVARHRAVRGPPLRPPAVRVISTDVISPASLPLRRL